MVDLRFISDYKIERIRRWRDCLGTHESSEEN